MVYTNVRGERKEKWFPTKILVKGNKTTANIYAHLDSSFKKLSLDTLTDTIKIKWENQKYTLWKTYRG